MSFILLVTEFKRSLKNSLVSIFLCLALGFALVVSFQFKGYLETLFTPPQWGASVLIAPKGLNPDLVHKSIIDGEPAGLLPEALYETLTAQIRDEQVKHQLSSSPLEFTAIMPFKKDGTVFLGALDYAAAKDFFSKHQTMLNSIPLADWQTEKANFAPNEKYKTAEWGNKTFFAALANGSPEYLSQLMTLINRRTVAEAFYIDADKSDSALKLNSLKMGLSILTGFILLLTILGLFLSFEILAAQRKQIFLVLTELKVKASVKTNFYIGQLFILTFIPICVGSIIGYYTWPLLKTFF